MPRGTEGLALDRFLIRESLQAIILSHLDNELLRVVRARPLVRVTVSLDRYSVGYLRRSLSLEGLEYGGFVVVTLHIDWRA